MKLLVLYRPDSEHGTPTETFIRDFRSSYESAAARVEILNIDSREGIATASLYDIMQYPAILVLADDGGLLKEWIGLPLPLMDEVAGYVYAAS